MKHTITYHTVPRETYDATDRLINQKKDSIDLYIEQLIWWNERVNLMSRDVSREIIYKHIRHSVLLTQFSAFRTANFLVDAGTGGGLPGIPLAIINPAKQFLLNDIVTKKIWAIKQIVKRMELDNIKFSNRSIENITPSQPSLIITKHAFKINELFALIKRLSWSRIFFYKGLDFKDELDNISPPIYLNIHRLFKNSGDSFFKNKAIIEMIR